jgi:peptidyl-prolyl cis-trans isomerase A (cyclophilin A)
LFSAVIVFKLRALTSTMRFTYFFLVAILFYSCTDSKSEHPHVTIQTKMGDIELELYPKQAPKSVAAFLSYIDSGYYENSSFYRVLNDFNQPSYSPKSEIIQGGIYRSQKYRSLKLPGIPHETTSQTNILHQNGVISLARIEPGSANTEFFICIGDQPGFDFGGENNPDGQGYAAFGRVIRGMDVVRKIYNMPESDQYFDPPVPIYEIER